MHALAIRAVFIPTLIYNMIVSRLLPGRRWWDRIDEHVILGALPLPWLVPALAAEGVRATVNTCIEYRGPTAAYAAHGIEQLWTPTLDFDPPSREHIERAVAFIDERVARGETVYIHCKAGRGRSATVAVCWLIAHYGLTRRAAQDRIEAARPHVNHHVWERAVVREFAAARAL